MNVEIVEFYPIEHNEKKEALSGTLRIRLPDIGIHILGVFATKRKDTWFFALPGKLSSHHETGESVRYPFITFEDKKKQLELMAAIREAGPTFIQKRLADTGNPLVWPQKQQTSRVATPLSR